MPMTAVWGALIVVFLVLEAVTVGLASIWFAIGAVCALLSAVLGAPVWLQIVWFVIISAATLAITRPLVKKYVNAKSQATNADRLIGQTCWVTERIDNLSGTGTVFIDGKTWSARTVDGGTAALNTLVVVRGISGVKLMVEPSPDAKKRRSKGKTN